MNPRARKVVDWVVGVTLILAGIVMGFVPILQGWVFILAGLAVLSSHSRWAARVHERVKRIGSRLRARRKSTPSRDDREGTEH